MKIRQGSSCYSIPIWVIICFWDWGVCPALRKLLGKALSFVPQIILGLISQAHKGIEAAPLSAQWETWAVGKFREQSFLIQRNQVILSQIRSHPSGSSQVSSLLWSPLQPRPLIESASPSSPLPQGLLCRGLGLMCVGCVLCIPLLGQKPRPVHRHVPPPPAQSSCSISWVKLTFHCAWIESTFPKYLGPSQRKSPDSVTQGTECQQEEKIMIFCCVVCGEAYKGDWGLCLQSQCGWRETDREFISFIHE